MNDKNQNEEVVEYDYTQSGFDKFLTRGKTKFVEYTEDAASQVLSQISTKSLEGNIEKDKVEDAVTDITAITGITTVTSSSVPDGSQTRFVTSLYDDKNPLRVMVAICQSTVYQDSVSSSNVVPYGSPTIASGHLIYANYEYSDNVNYAPSIGKALTFTHFVRNNTGAPHSYVQRFRWYYVGKVTGT